jgi:hypothetical protein
MNLQDAASSHGEIVWVSGALPRSVHDNKADMLCPGGQAPESLTTVTTVMEDRPPRHSRTNRRILSRCRLAGMSLGAALRMEHPLGGQPAAEPAATLPSASCCYRMLAARLASRFHNRRLGNPRTKGSGSGEAGGASGRAGIGPPGGTVRCVSLSWSVP